MLSAVFRSTYLALSTPVVGHPLPISLSGNLKNGLGFNTTMKFLFYFRTVWKNCLGFSVGYQRAPGTSEKKKRTPGTSERFVANCGVGPSTRGQGDSASLVKPTQDQRR